MKTAARPSYTPGPYGGEDEPLPVAIANARLIAAAPELLETLVLALPYVEDAQQDPCYKPGAVAKVIAEIRAAIAKATGEQTP